MKQLLKSTATAAAGLAALTLLAAPGFANTEHHGVRESAPAQSEPAPVQLAHMGQGPTGAPGMMAPGQGYAPGYGMGPCQGYQSGSGMMGSGMMGPGMMAPGMMGPGMMGPGMMGPGMMGYGQGYGPGQGYGMGPGMMGPGMGGPGMGGPGMGGQGMMGPELGQAVTPSKDLSADDVRHFFEHRLEMHGNKRLKVGEVKEADQDTVFADIVTQDGSLVQRLKVDRHSGQMQQVE